MPDTCIVNSHRFGDIASNLPIARHLHQQGHTVWWVVHEQFASILEGVSYVRPIVFRGDMTDCEDALRVARNRCPAGTDYLVLQPAGNPTRPPVPCARFSAEPWSRAGLLDKFHALPLVFDRRDADRDAATRAKYLPATGGKPLLLLCLKGHSSAWDEPEALAFRQWLIGLARKELGWCVLDIGQLHLPHVLDLLPLLEAADVLVSIDTLPIHLAYATGTPTLVLSRSHEWSKSEPRSHWLGQWTYPQANSAEGRQAIAQCLADCPATLGSLVRDPAAMACRPLWHVHHQQPNPDPATAARNARAAGSWTILAGSDRAWWPIVHRNSPTGRTAQSLGDARDCPFVKDVFDLACSKAAPGDLVVYTNADIALVPETPSVLRAALKAAPCCFSSRVDVDAITSQLSLADLARMPLHPGADLFAFTPQWWAKQRESFPDVLLGYEGWDWIMKRIMLRDNPQARLVPPLVYHARHGAFWESHKHNVGNAHNRRLCREWALAHGFAACIKSESDALFHADHDVPELQGR